MTTRQLYASSGSMRPAAEADDDKRFTISDYTDDPLAQPGPSNYMVHSSIPAKPERVYFDEHMRETLAERSEDLRKGSAESSGSSKGSRTLHLHQDRPAHQPYIPPSSPTYPPATELHPHPSLSRSFASQYEHGMPPEDEQGSDRGDADSLKAQPPPSPMSIQEKSELGQAELQRGPSKSESNGWRHFILPKSLACRTLLGTLVVQTLIDLAVEGNILYRFNEEVASADSSDLEIENKRRLPVYLIIFGLAHLWQLVLAVIAIRTRNTVQVAAVTAFSYAFLGYAIVEIYELREILGENTLATALDAERENLLSLPLNILTAVVLAVVAVTCVILSVLCYFLRREFGWQRYRFLGADLAIRRYYFRFQVFECIVFYSAFFCSGFGIQFIFLVLQRTDAEYIITWLFFPLSILLLVMGRLAAKYENRPCMGGFLFGLLCGLAYFVFKLVRIWQQSTTTYANLSRSLTLFDALSIASLVGCFVGGLLCYLDFGKGLKEAVLSQPNASFTRTWFGLHRRRIAEKDQAELGMSETRIIID